MKPAELEARLLDFLQRSLPGREPALRDLRRLTGGASRETWAFDLALTTPDEALPLILRCDPRRLSAVGSSDEFDLLTAAARAGARVPRVFLRGDDSLGMPFYLMQRIDGESIPRKLLRDERFAAARRVLPAEAAASLAAIHRIPVAELPPLLAPPPGTAPALAEVARYEQIHRAVAAEPSPVFELAFRWLAQHAPAVAGEPRLVHGDFRMGNLLVGEAGLSGVLDWELAHLGDPSEDLGWFCVRSWRFGGDALPAGGIASREEFLAHYAAAGGAPVEPGRLRFWEAFGNLRWGITCQVQVKAVLDGALKHLELASIGRRVAETEWELLALMESR